MKGDGDTRGEEELRDRACYISSLEQQQQRTTTTTKTHNTSTTHACTHTLTRDGHNKKKERFLFMSGDLHLVVVVRLTVLVVANSTVVLRLDLVVAYLVASLNLLEVALLVVDLN